MLRSSRCWTDSRDRPLVWMAAVHAIAVIAWPAIPVIALGVWWNSNTVSHNFIHRPFFRPRWLNRLFSLYISLLLGIPQSRWRDLHLSHHAGTGGRFRRSGDTAMESVSILLLWTALAVLKPHFFMLVYLPGYALGLALCWCQGYYEHAAGVTSHYGAIYNLLCFNDGYHAEHHARPGRHWTELARVPAADAVTSRWPPLLRWIDYLNLPYPNVAYLNLEGLERLGPAIFRAPKVGTAMSRSRHQEGLTGAASGSAGDDCRGRAVPAIRIDPSRVPDGGTNHGSGFKPAASGDGPAFFHRQGRIPGADLRLWQPLRL